LIKIDQMEHYVTLFDSLFLPQGIALHISMERNIKSYTLWILCVDDEAYEFLIKLQLPNVKLLHLSSIATDELLSLKYSRSKSEYCWTLTPFALRYVFEADVSVLRVTYLDADIWFRKNPDLIFEEFNASGRDVLITDHSFAPEYDQSSSSGQYCVQFLSFTRRGESIRGYWEECCFNWCFARYEDGKFGDQKYLDEWPSKYPNQIHILKNKELALAPWNATRFPYGNCVFWHFQELRIISVKEVNIGEIYAIPSVVIKNIYEPYLKDLREAIGKLGNNGYRLKIQKKKYTVFGRIRGHISYLMSRVNNFRPRGNLKL
jgi:hypothetical protein